MRKLSDLSVVIVTHIIQLSDDKITYGPPPALIEFLRERVAILVVITHPFSYCPYTRSTARVFVEGKQVHEKVFLNMKGPELAVFLKDIIFTLYFILVHKIRCYIYVGADCLNALAGIFLRKIGFSRFVIYYAIDYTPYRFKNPLKNALYHVIDRISARSADYVWNLSGRMAKVRERQGTRGSRNLVVPVGVIMRKIKHPQQISRNSLVFVSHLVKSKGLQLVLEALPEIVNRVSDTKLVIIGTGPYEDTLRKIVKEKGLENNIEFLGSMNHERLLQVLPKFGIGLAPYSTDSENITWFADPTKVKEYLACGLPIIITKVPEFADEIEENEAGIVVNYHKKELAEAAVKLLSNDEIFKRCKENALKLAAKYDWEKICYDAITVCLQKAT